MCDVAAAYIADAGLADRISLLNGDARTTDWPANQDAVIMSYLLSAVAAPDIARLLRRAYDALGPGGIVVLHDFMVADDLSGPTSAALWLLFNVVSDPDAPQLSPGMLIEATLIVGFVQAEEFELLPGITRSFPCGSALAIRTRRVDDRSRNGPVPRQSSSSRRSQNLTYPTTRTV